MSRYTRPDLPLRLLFTLTSEWTTPAAYYHTKMPLANQAWDVVNETGHFRVSGHLLNDVYGQQCCSVSSTLNYSSVFTLDWAYRCIIPGLMLLSFHTAAPCLLEQSLSGVHFIRGNKRSRRSRCIEILGFHFPTFFFWMTSAIPNSPFSAWGKWRAGGGGGEPCMPAVCSAMQLARKPSGCPQPL